MKQRIDKYLYDQGLLQSRSSAQDAILEHRVLVNDKVVDKNSFLIDEDDNVVLIEAEISFASRAGHKLNGALDQFEIDLSNRNVADIGASTGGFSDVCLKRGAKKVYAMDVGKDQLVESLRKDPRVVNMEGINCRYLTMDMFEEPCDFACIDVSFISLELILPAVKSILNNTQEMVILIKPQFEAGKKDVGKNGIVKNKVIHQKILEKMHHFILSLNLYAHHLAKSSLVGRDGNQEYVMHISNIKTKREFDYRRIVNN